MILAELMALAKAQERLTQEFQTLMDRFEGHPFLRYVSADDERLQSLRHSREVSQQALQAREEIAVQLQDFNARLEANIRLLTHILADMDEITAAQQGRSVGSDGPQS